VPLVIAGIANSAGSVDVVNTGAIVTTGLVSASGNVEVVANSPLTIGVPGITAGGGISLSASNLTSAGNLTLDGPITAGSSVVLIAANNLVQNSSVFGVNGVTATAGGAISYGPFATSNNSPVRYSAGGVGVTAPPTELFSGTPAAQTDVLVTFLDLFEAAVQKQQAGALDTNPDGSKKKKSDDAIVTEGEICR